MMTNPPHESFQALKKGRFSPFRKKGFSLVEVSLALAVLSFSLVAMLGIMPVGLSTIRQAMDTVTEGQIIQKLGSHALLTPFSKIGTEFGSPRYFTEEGIEITDPTQAYYTATFKIANPEYPGRGNDKGTSPLGENMRMIKVDLASGTPGRAQGTNFYNILVPCSGDTDKPGT